MTPQDQYWICKVMKELLLLNDHWSMIHILVSSKNKISKQITLITLIQIILFLNKSKRWNLLGTNYPTYKVPSILFKVEHKGTPMNMQGSRRKFLTLKIFHDLQFYNFFHKWDIDTNYLDDSSCK